MSLPQPKDIDEPFRRHRQTKIVATVGPASSDKETLKKLFEAGADVFRLNFSHGSHEDHKARYDILRELEQDSGRPIGILADLQGPKIRIGKFASGEIALREGMALRLDLEEAPGDETRVRLPHPEVLEALEDYSDILLDDGRVQLKVTGKGKGYVDTQVVAGQKLSDRKGVNLPGVLLKVSPLTEKDRRDLDYALDLGVDWIALSFVQRPEDVAEAKKLIAGRAGLISKIEKPSAVQKLGQIIDLSDAIMIARGDLGVEMPAEQIPSLQKRIIREVRKVGKPVIVATQMLESMTSSPMPTRAEASDVATAIYDGADAVMLSAETASGQYPVEAVTMMKKIARGVEKDPMYRPIMDAEHPDPDQTAADAITAAAGQVVKTIKASCIVNFTTSGSTALRTARERPPVPILCITEQRSAARRLALSYGVHAVQTEDVKTFDDMVEKATRIAKREGLAAAGERLVITAGVPFGTPGSTNILRIAWVE